MRILYGCKSDEVVHRFITYDEWRIAFRVVLEMDCMIKVIT